MTIEEMKNTRLHLLGQDPISLKEFKPEMPLTDATWLNSDSDFFSNLRCPRSIGSCPKTDIESIIGISPSPKASLLSLKFILARTDYTEFEWENPKNPPLGEDELKPTYNIALKIIHSLCQNNRLWVAGIPNTRSSETWRHFVQLPKEEINSLAPDLTPKIVEPKDISLILGRKVKTLSPTNDFQAEIIVYDNIGLEVHKNKHMLEEIPFVCPLVGEDELCGAVSYKGPLLLANKAFLNILETKPSKAKEIYKKSSEDLFFYRSQECDQNEYDYDHFRADYPENIDLLANPGLAIKKKIQWVEKTISESIADLTKSILPSLCDKISQDCQSTKELRIKEVKWDPKNGLSLQASWKSKQINKKIELKDGKTKVFSES
jgi:hypothetical protein